MNRATAWVILVLLLLALLAGCIGASAADRDKAAFLQASDSYQATTQILVTYRQAGKIDDPTWQRIKLADAMVYAGLVEWQEALELGTPPIEAAAKVNKALQTLLIERLEVTNGRE